MAIPNFRHSSATINDFDNFSEQKNLNEPTIDEQFGKQFMYNN